MELDIGKPRDAGNEATHPAAVGTKVKAVVSYRVVLLTGNGRGRIVMDWRSMGYHSEITLVRGPV